MMGITLEERELLDLAKFKITRMSAQELREFVKDIEPSYIEVRKEGLNGPQSFRN